MFLCYIDESGAIPGNTSHYVLAGLSISVENWRACDAAVSRIKKKYDLESAEIHVAWMRRSYLEQDRIPNFETLDHAKRRAMVESQRTAELQRLNKANKHKQYRQTKKNYKQTAAYVHLTRAERETFINELAACVAIWGYARLFAECIDKVHFSAQVRNKSPHEQAFEQIVSRFETYLKKISKQGKETHHGLMIHDNNPTVARQHTDMMKRFHADGTLWTGIKYLIETPLFVDSQLTSMIQIADLCAYALRRYLENDEKSLFEQIFKRADRVGDTAVGIRHFTKLGCKCMICSSHRKSPPNKGK